MTPGSSTPVLSQQRAKEFADKWQHTEEEERYAKSFWTDFFRQLCGVDDEKIAGIEFEYPVQSVSTGRKNRIDVYWKNTVLIEHKSKGEDLDRAELQARGYLRSLPKGYQPKTLIICDFATFRIIDVRQNRTQEFLLKDLPKHINKFESIISGNRPQFLDDEIEVDQKAAKLMANLYIELEKNNYGGHETGVFLSRLLFLLFGDDTNMWEHNLVKKILFATAENGSDVGETLSELFEFVNTSDAKRKKSEKFKDLPYINGGIFAENIQVIKFNKGMRAVLIDAANYDWSGINPTIFGALFQLIKSKEERAALGEHYTSEENINKIIYPLLLDNLQDRLTDAWSSKKELKLLRQYLGKIKFLDPACGCGNFLVVAYKHLRQLELELIVRLQELEGKESDIGLDGTLGLSISLNQFYGIEIEEWPAQVARMALFLTDHQENLRLERITGVAPNRFPIKDYANIQNTNALQTDWRKLVKFDENLFILGNPPFVGSRKQSDEQRADQESVWDATKGFGMSDYVSNWFILAAKLAKGSETKCAFVATSSITQGDQAANIYGLLEEFGYEIDFAHRSFAWSNESTGVAAVHCVIIGFSTNNHRAIKRLWDYPSPKDEPIESNPKFINAYLVDGPNVLVRARKSPFRTALPPLLTGNEPRDGGHLSNIKIADADEIRATDPTAAKYLRVIMGSDELMNGVGNRFCLWLVDANPTEISKSKILKSRVQAVRDNRMKAAGTKSSKARTADTPAIFSRIAQPSKRFMAVPSVSSEKRDYIPIAFFDKDVIVNNAIFYIESEDLALFGLLESRPFTVWVQNVSSRLESRYQISASAVYNTFPFPILNEKSRLEVEYLASEILSERSKFKDSKLGDLYDPLLMPSALLKLHNKLDSVALKAFGLTAGATDSEILGLLFREYARLSDDKLL